MTAENVKKVKTDLKYFVNITFSKDIKITSIRLHFYMFHVNHQFELKLPQFSVYSSFSEEIAGDNNTKNKVYHYLQMYDSRKEDLRV